MSQPIGRIIDLRTRMPDGAGRGKGAPPMPTGQAAPSRPARASRTRVRIPSVSPLDWLVCLALALAFVAILSRIAEGS